MAHTYYCLLLVDRHISLADGDNYSLGLSWTQESTYFSDRMLIRRPMLGCSVLVEAKT